VRPWGVFREKKRIVRRRSGGKKCYNGRERVKNIFKEIK
jgi:hypothetical protein